jgi:hypothetical protein
MPATEPDWDDALAFPLVLADTGATPVWPTVARLCETGSHVWARFDCRADSIVATKTTYNDRVCEEDAVEVFLWPDGDPHLYEVQVSPIGVYRDVRVGDNGGPAQAFDGTWRCAGLSTDSSLCHDDDGRLVGWTATVGIPWAGLGLDGPPEGWRLGLFRIHRTDPAEWSSLRAVDRRPVDFHDNGMLVRRDAVS